MKTIYTIKITGLNLDNLLNIFYSKKIKISNIYRKKDNSRTMFLDISRVDYVSAMSGRVFDKFDVCVVRKRGMENFLFRLFSLSGALFGVFISLFVGFSINSKIWHIDIDLRGEENIVVRQAVENTLSKNNISIGSNLGNISLYDLSQDIVSSNEEIAAATVEKNGTTLQVKIYLASSVYKTGDLVATKNGVITSVLVAAGESLVEAGDVVSEGDALLKADMSGNAVGTVMAKVYYMSSIVYNENIERLKPTGNVKKQSVLELFGIKFGVNNLPGYKYYETKVNKISPFKNFILPIFSTEYEYVEMAKVVKFVPFEEVEADLKEQAKSLAMQNINSACQIINIDYTIRREGNIVKVDCFIESLENIAG